MNLQHRLATSVVLLFMVIGLGVFGYHLIEGWTLADSFYMTMITISTVGFGEIRQMDANGRILTIILIVASLSVGGYAITNLTSYLISGEIIHRYRHRRMYRKIKRMKKHVIIAGYGKLGREIAEELQRMDAEFVIIENDPEHAEEARQAGFKVIEGDASRDDVLEAANVKEAYGLIAALTGDATNVMVTITAREISPELYIVARGIDHHSQAKLRRAGADRVELPFKISGRRISTLILKPGFVDFVDLFSRTFADNLHMTQMEVKEESELIGKSLKEIDLRRATGGLVIMAILHEDGDLIVHPDGDVAIQQGDRLLVLGTEDQVHRFQNQFHVTEAAGHSGGFHVRQANIKHGARSHEA